MKTHLYFFYHISLSSSLNEKCLKKESVEKIKTHFVFNNIFFKENRAIYEICGKIQYSRAGHR